MFYKILCEIISKKLAEVRGECDIENEVYDVQIENRECKTLANEYVWTLV